MFSKLGLQLYTIRDYMKDNESIDKSLERLVEIGYTEAQTAGQESEEFANLTKKHGITIVGTHTDYNAIINEPDRMMKMHDMLGTKNIGIGGMPEEARHNLEGLNAFIDKFNALADKYYAEGFKLTYHNHSYEFKKINGKIDRVDKCGSYVRIIDYKTGKTHEDDEAFYTGNNLQLYLYMNAYITGEDKPAGAYYFPVSDRFAEKGKGPVYAMRGKTLQDMEVIMQSDTTLTKLSRETTAIDATLSFTDSGVEGNNKIIPPSVMQAYLDYSVMISEKGAEEIAEGIIAPSPYEGECAFCKFSAVCGFDVSTGRARKVKPDGRRSVDSEMIAEAVEVQNEINANK